MVTNTIARTGAHQNDDHADPVATRSDKDPRTELIGHVYKAAENRAYWETALEQLAQATRSSRAALIVHDRESGRGYIAYSHRIFPPQQRDYESQFAQVNPWLAAYEDNIPFGKAVPGDAILSYTRLLDTDFFQNFLQPLALFHTLHAGIARRGSTEVHLLLGRREGDGRYETAHIEFVQEIVEHMTRAWELGHRDSPTDALGRYSLEALNRLTIGVAILDAMGQILAMNEEAEGIVGSGDGLALGPEGLEIRVDGRMRKLSTLLTEGETRTSRRFQLLTAQRASRRRPISMLVWPLYGPLQLSNSTQQGALLFFSDPYRPDAPFDETLMRELFTMTPAEARVASKMARGKSTDRVSEELGISIHTARTHLKRIFEKTGVDRQAELVHVLFNAFGFLRMGGRPQDSRRRD